jgi:hypothetical protein
VCQWKTTTTATQELQQLNNNKNDYIQTFLQVLKPTESTDYSLWTAIKKIKQVKKPSPPLRTSQGTWARSNVTELIANVFSHILQKMNLKEDEEEEKSAYTISGDPVPT